VTLDIALRYGPTSSQRRSDTARAFRDHTVLLDTYAFIHEWNEPVCFPSRSGGMEG